MNILVICLLLEIVIVSTSGLMMYSEAIIFSENDKICLVSVIALEVISNIYFMLHKKYIDAKNNRCTQPIMANVENISINTIELTDSICWRNPNDLEIDERPMGRGVQNREVIQRKAILSYTVNDKIIKLKYTDGGEANLKKGHQIPIHYNPNDYYDFIIDEDMSNNCMHIAILVILILLSVGIGIVKPLVDSV